ncbi:MAG: mechanosensitive ion channel [Neisseria sp.]|nr:mechanosensitive ion channel [Neisseria sp.]
MFWQEIENFISDGPIRVEIWLSLIWLLVLQLLRLVLLQIQFYRHPQSEIEQKRRWMVTSRNWTVVLSALGLIGVWAVQIQAFALSMVALAAATVVATKELIMCLSGSLLRFSTQQYIVGDFIRIGGHRGRVVDINLFTTLIMQIGPHEAVGQLSGKTVSFPNSLLLSQAVERDNILGHYVVHTLDIPVPIHLNPDALIPPLKEILRRECSSYVDEITRYFNEVQVQKTFITPAAVPRITCVPHDDKVYHIVVRFASPLARRLEIQQQILNEYIRIQYSLLK